MVTGSIRVKLHIGDRVSDGISHKPGIQATFEFDEEVPVASFEELMVSPTFSLGLNEDQPGGIVQSSSQIETFYNDAFPFFDLPRTVSTYTSSFIEFQIPTGSFEFLSKFYPPDTSNITVNINDSQSAVVSMSATPPIQLTDLKFESEHSGYTGSGVNDANIVTNTTRSVLYGDPHTTNASTQSANWSNHPSASIYASHSVTRFRVRGKIVEPFGPAKSTTTIKLKADSSNYNIEKANFEIINTNDTNNSTLDSYLDNEKLINDRMTSI